GVGLETYILCAKCTCFFIQGHNLHHKPVVRKPVDGLAWVRGNVLCYCDYRTNKPVAMIARPNEVFEPLRSARPLLLLGPRSRLVYQLATFMLDLVLPHSHDDNFPVRTPTGPTPALISANGTKMRKGRRAC